MRGPEDFLLVVNAGNKDADVEWMKARAAGRDVEVADRSSEWALLALQGPRAAAILKPLASASLDGLKYYHFTEGEVAGRKCLISRTGYTGEDGFELYHRPAESAALAEALLAAGKEQGLELCGLGARDSLRLEAGFPLYGHELSREISPLTAGLGWTVKLEREGDFSGKAALAAEKKAGSPRRVVYFRTGDRRIIRAETPVAGEDGAVAGRVLSGTLSPMLGEAFGSALVDGPAVSKPLHVDVRGTHIQFQLVKPPFIELKKSP
jgi:aminomethyltransferase